MELVGPYGPPCIGPVVLLYILVTESIGGFELL